MSTAVIIIQGFQGSIRPGVLIVSHSQFSEEDTSVGSSLKIHSSFYVKDTPLASTARVHCNLRSGEKVMEDRVK